jgi:hypothetical protein
MAACWTTTFDRTDVPQPNHRFFDLNAEQSLAVVVSVGILFLAAAAAFAWSRRGDGGRPVLGLVAFLVFMAVEEGAFLHERLESRLDVDWQILYLPVIAVGAWLWLRSLARLPRPWPAALLVLGAVSWALSQVFEALQWKGERLVHVWMLFPEEVGEMVGSALFALAFLAALQVRTARPGRGRPGRGTAPT